jgi:hypothetical protein
MRPLASLKLRVVLGMNMSWEFKRPLAMYVAGPSVEEAHPGVLIQVSIRVI